MSDVSLQGTIESEYETELSRLGSSKAIYALTGGEMEAGAVLAALADRSTTAASTFADWTDDTEDADAFAAAAATAESLADRIAGSADDVAPTDAPGPMDETLRALDDPDARLGGLLAWTMVADRTLAQVVGFYVGNADPQGADRFRDLRSAVADLRERTDARLADADVADARDGASRVIEAAYAAYVEKLEGLGVEVKPVC